MMCTYTEYKLCICSYAIADHLFTFSLFLLFFALSISTLSLLSLLSLLVCFGEKGPWALRKNRHDL